MRQRSIVLRLLQRTVSEGQKYEKEKYVAASEMDLVCAVGLQYFAPTL